MPPTCDQIQQGLLSICGLHSSQRLFRLGGVILKEQHILRVKSSDLVFKGLTEMQKAASVASALVLFFQLSVLIFGLYTHKTG